MSESEREEMPLKLSLDRISTQWSVVNDPVQFVLRYAPAIRSYLDALIKNSHDAEEVAQDIMMKAVQQGFMQACPERGRFRDYLKIAVRNAALSRLRRKQEAIYGDMAFLGLSADADPQKASEDQWLADWRRCILERAWRRLDSHQQRSPGNLFHTVLRLAVDFPDEDSVALAERASQQTGKPLRADAFRKQLSRARHKFAELLCEEVADTLDEPTPRRIEEELIDIGLLEYVRDFMPPDWPSQPI